MSKTQAKRLMKNGIVVSKNAAENMTKERADRILNMKHVPMYVNDQFVQWMKGRQPDVGMTTIEANRNLPAFSGVDGKVYYLTHGEKRRVPQANGDLLVNRGQAERASK